MNNKNMLYIAVAVIIVALIGVYAVARGGINVPIMLTDPPSVPAGAQHLLISYSSVAVHTTNNASTNESGWATATGSGTVDLMALVNVSNTIANVHVAANSTINLLRFNITSIRITIDNLTHNVSTPNHRLTIAVVGGQKVNATSGILIDLFPTVHANATGYILIPAARALVVGSTSNAPINTNIGGISRISSHARLGLGLDVT